MKQPRKPYTDSYLYILSFVQASYPLPSFTLFGQCLIYTAGVAEGVEEQEGAMD